MGSPEQSVEKLRQLAGFLEPLKLAEELNRAAEYLDVVNRRQISAGSRLEQVLQYKVELEGLVRTLVQRLGRAGIIVTEEELILPSMRNAQGGVKSTLKGGPETAHKTPEGEIPRAPMPPEMAKAMAERAFHPPPDIPQEGE